ncbi:MAG: hypothetical protein AB7V07_10150 [Candidatus Delongbacteria bacterium]
MRYFWLRGIFLLIVLTICISSCNTSKNQNEIDLSYFGSVNIIKEIGGEMYVLNSTESSVYKLKEGRLELFRDIDIGGRDFVLDFDITGAKVCYSNTYDEIFVSSSSSIEDTIKVLNPDRIEVADSKLFVTSRKAEDGRFYIRSVDAETGKLLNKVSINDEAVSGMTFSKISIAVNSYRLWAVNDLRKRVEVYNFELELMESYPLDVCYEYGNFYISDEWIRILSSRDGKIFIAESPLLEFKQDITDTGIGSGNFDISASCITGNIMYLYDFINSRISIFR